MRKQQSNRTTTLWEHRGLIVALSTVCPLAGTRLSRIYHKLHMLANVMKKKLTGSSDTRAQSTNEKLSQLWQSRERRSELHRVVLLIFYEILAAHFFESAIQIASTFEWFMCAEAKFLGNKKTLNVCSESKTTDTRFVGEPVQHGKIEASSASSPPRASKPASHRDLTVRLSVIGVQLPITYCQYHHWHHSHRTNSALKQTKQLTTTAFCCCPLRAN